MWLSGVSRNDIHNLHYSVNWIIYLTERERTGDLFSFSSNLLTH